MPIRDGVLDIRLHVVDLIGSRVLWSGASVADLDLWWGRNHRPGSHDWAVRLVLPAAAVQHWASASELRRLRRHQCCTVERRP